jgi:hypothetical protein
MYKKKRNSLIQLQNMILKITFAALLFALTSVNLFSQTTITSTFGNRPLPKPYGITGTSFGIQTGRLFRDATPTTCGSNTGFTIFNASTNYNYEYYAFTAATSGCLNVSVSTMSTTSVYVAVYAGSFDPSNCVTNCIGQQGSSGVISFACPVTASQPYVLVLMETNTGAGTGTNYSLTLDNVYMPPAVIPISVWWIMVAFLIIAGAAFLRFWIKKTRTSIE